MRDWTSGGQEKEDAGVVETSSGEDSSESAKLSGQ